MLSVEYYGLIFTDSRGSNGQWQDLAVLRNLARFWLQLERLNFTDVLQFMMQPCPSRLDLQPLKT
jgi:hypothetical protein